MKKIIILFILLLCITKVSYCFNYNPIKEYDLTHLKIECLVDTNHRKDLVTYGILTNISLSNTAFTIENNLFEQEFTVKLKENKEQEIMFKITDYNSFVCIKMMDKNTHEIIRVFARNTLTKDSCLTISNIDNNKYYLSYISRTKPTTDFCQIKRLSYHKTNWGGRRLSGTCNVNALCQTGINDGPWCNQIRSVVDITIPFIYENSVHRFTCSASILNNDADDLKPYLLTAYHCVSNQQTLRINEVDQEVTGVIDYNNLEVLYNWQSPVCSPTAYNEPQCKQVGVKNSYSLTDGECRDITLLELRENIPLQYNVYYSGWNSGDAGDLDMNVEVTGIHHPRGDVKKISQGEIDHHSGSKCWYVDWRIGMAEHGSSGSPLFYRYNGAKRVIGVCSLFLGRIIKLVMI